MQAGSHRAFKSDIIGFANEYVNKNAEHTRRDGSRDRDRDGSRGWGFLPLPDDNQLNRRAEMPSPPSRLDSTQLSRLTD